MQHKETGTKTGRIDVVVSTDIELPKHYRVGVVLKGFTLPTQAKPYLKTSSFRSQRVSELWSKALKPFLSNRRREAYAAAKWMQQVGIKRAFE